MSKIAWRFAQPWPTGQVCRVLCAGPHFEAGRLLLTDLLRQRGILLDDNQPNPQGQVQVAHAPTDQQVMDLAPTVHVAIPFMQRFTPSFIQQASQLRLIQQFGVGLEGVAVETATQHGIAVSNIPASETGNAQTTAEHALLLTLTLLRQAQYGLPKGLQQGILGGLPLPRSLFGKNVTIVGYGAVGSKITEYMMALGANLTVVRKRRWVDDDDLPSTVQRANDLHHVLPSTDVLILACVLTPETRHLINRQRLSLLPPHAVVVNVARGPIVEYQGLKEALDTGALAGFASDVGLETKDGQPAEPWVTTDPLHAHPAVYFTPHVGGYTDYTYNIMAKSIVESIHAVMKSQPPRVFVNNENIIH